jgi:predicted nucleic acid-binding protein
MAQAEWLADKSALIRLDRSANPEEWSARIRRGLVRVSTPTLLEIGYSSRSADEWMNVHDSPPVMQLAVEYLTPRAERRAVEVQGLLASRGLHRAPSVPDLIIAAIAETAGLTVLHVDKDFDLIAEITGQPVERLQVTV